MATSTLLAALTVMMMSLPTSDSLGYTVQYYDCTAPANIQTYDRKSICQEERAQKEAATHYSLVQTIRAREITARSCQIIRSAIHSYCGAYSHSKLVTIEIELPLDVSAAECARVYQHGSYTTQTDRCTLYIETRRQ